MRCILDWKLTDMTSKSSHLEAQCIVGYEIFQCALLYTPHFGKWHPVYSTHLRNKSTVVCFFRTQPRLKTGSLIMEEKKYAKKQHRSGHIFLSKPGKQLDVLFSQHTTREYWADLCCVWVPLARESKALYCRMREVWMSEWN